MCSESPSGAQGINPLDDLLEDLLREWEHSDARQPAEDVTPEPVIDELIALLVSSSEPQDASATSEAATVVEASASVEDAPAGELAARADAPAVEPVNSEHAAAEAEEPWLQPLSREYAVQLQAMPLGDALAQLATLTIDRARELETAAEQGPQPETSPLITREKSIADWAVEDRYVLFTLGARIYAAPISSIRETDRIPATTRVPGAPEFVLGVFPHRGDVLPLIELARLLDDDEIRNPAGRKVVIVKGDDGPLGLAVDQLDGLAGFPKDQITRGPEGEGFTLGWADWNQRRVQILDFNRLMTDGRVRELAG